MEIRIENLTYVYEMPSAAPVPAISNVWAVIPSQSIAAVVGATGSGKTTLVQHFNGLLVPSRGRVVVGPLDLSLPEHCRAARHRVGLVFQFPEIQLFEETVYKDVAFGPRNLGLSEPEVETRFHESMAMVGLDPGRYRRMSPFHLSGGEKRRAAIAGILAMEPDVLVLDEPFVGLDLRGTRLIEKVIRQYREKGRTVVFVSHDMDLAARLADKFLVLDQGRLVYSGPGSGLFSDTAVLDAAGLELPRVCRVMEEFRKQGYQVRTDILTVEGAKQELARSIAE